MWHQIAQNLNSSVEGSFNVDQRGVLDRYNKLKSLYIKKMSDEEKASGIAPNEPTSVENLLEELVEIEKEEEKNFQECELFKSTKKENDRKNAEVMRNRSMETISETSEREGKPAVKRGKVNNTETLQYLQQKSKQDHEIRKEEIILKRDKQELNKKQLELQATAFETMHKQNEAMTQTMTTFINNTNKFQLAMMERMSNMCSVIEKICNQK